MFNNFVLLPEGNQQCLIWFSLFCYGSKSCFVLPFLDTKVADDWMFYSQIWYTDLSENGCVTPLKWQCSEGSYGIVMNQPWISSCSYPSAHQFQAEFRHVIPSSLPGARRCRDQLCHLSSSCLHPSPHPHQPLSRSGCRRQQDKAGAKAKARAALLKNLVESERIAILKIKLQANMEWAGNACTQGPLRGISWYFMFFVAKRVYSQVDMTRWDKQSTHKHSIHALWFLTPEQEESSEVFIFINHFSRYSWKSNDSWNRQPNYKFAWTNKFKIDLSIYFLWY